MKIDGDSKMDYQTFLTVIKEYEDRWVGIFEGIKGEMIDPSVFYNLANKFKNESIFWNTYLKYSDLPKYDLVKLQFQLVRAKNRIDSYAVRAYALSVSKWKDKHSGLFGFLNPIKKINFGDVGLETK